MTQPTVHVNGNLYPLPADSRRLVDWLRDNLQLTGTKRPCSEGQCGGCTVLIDGKAVLACCVLAATLADRHVTTIEGVDRNDPLLLAFINQGAVQCGYCTPGMIMAAKGLLNGKERPLTTEAVRMALAGNICRCTGYVQIIEAVLAAVEEG